MQGQQRVDLRAQEHTILINSSSLAFTGHTRIPIPNDTRPAGVSQSEHGHSPRSPYDYTTVLALCPTSLPPGCPETEIAGNAAASWAQHAH